MQIQLTQKERMFLEDAKHQEDICVKKYQSYAQQAQDPQLNLLLNKLATEEQHHADSLSKLLQGQLPDFSHSTQEQQTAPQGGQNQATAFKQAMNNETDEVLCSDLLSTEKYVSSTYDTWVFESTNPAVRQTLQHIQKDEQKHGEQLFTYMNIRGMYTAK